MPRVHHRKAGKDYPDQEITKGEMYYTAHVKTGPASGITIRSKDPIPASRLTQSAFKSAWLSAEEGWCRSGKGAEDISAAAEAIREAGQEAQESFDNMPEGLQQGDTGQMLENRVSEAERVADELDSLADELESLEDPGEMDEVEEPEQDAGPDAWAEYEAWGQWQEEQDHYQTELARIPEEADSLIGDMPE